jgi:hypothetical protein
VRRVPVVMDAQDGLVPSLTMELRVAIQRMTACVRSSFPVWKCPPTKTGGCTSTAMCRKPASHFGADGLHLERIAVYRADPPPD